MARYSSHEHTRKIRTRAPRLTDLEKGILARLKPTVMDGDTRYFNYTTQSRTGEHQLPVGKRLDLRVMHTPRANNGNPYVQVSGWRNLTLIERPAENRLRILWVGGWWVEIQLAPFQALLEAAATRYGKPLPPLTTVVIHAPRPVQSE
jgi:hypothetical protein